MGAKNRRSRLRSTQRIMGRSSIMIIILVLVLQGFLNGLIHRARYTELRSECSDRGHGLFTDYHAGHSDRGHGHFID